MVSGRSASSSLASLSRYLYHQRWLWSVPSGLAPALPLSAIAQLLSILTEYVTQPTRPLGAGREQVSTLGLDAGRMPKPDMAPPLPSSLRRPLCRGASTEHACCSPTHHLSSQLGDFGLWFLLDLPLLRDQWFEQGHQQTSLPGWPLESGRLSGVGGQGLYAESLPISSRPTTASAGPQSPAFGRVPLRLQWGRHHHHGSGAPDSGTCHPSQPLPPRSVIIPGHSPVSGVGADGNAASLGPYGLRPIPGQCGKGPEVLRARVGWAQTLPSCPRTSPRGRLRLRRGTRAWSSTSSSHLIQPPPRTGEARPPSHLAPVPLSPSGPEGLSLNLENQGRGCCL